MEQQPAGFQLTQEGIQVARGLLGCDLEVLDDARHQRLPWCTRSQQLPHDRTGPVHYQIGRAFEVQNDYLAVDRSPFQAIAIQLQHRLARGDGLHAKSVPSRPTTPAPADLAGRLNPCCEKVRCVPPRALRLCYRVASPLAHIFWTITRARLRGAKCALVRGAHGREVLLVRHTYGDGRLWHLPGGLLKRGERPVDGARRELREELGVECDELDELCARDLRIYGHVDRIHYFRCALASQPVELEPNSAEIAEAAWFALDAPPRPLGKQVRQVLAVLASLPGKPGSPARG